MHNELLFLTHLIFILGVTLGAFLIDRALLRAVVCVEVVLANIFVVNQMPLCGVTACGGGMYIVGSMCGLLLLQTYEGKAYARRTFYASFGMATIFLVLTLFQIWYAPHPLDRLHPLFVLLLACIPRITAASFVAHFSAQYCTLLLQRVLLRITQGGLVAIMTTIALILGQVLDSTLFFIGSFAGRVTVVHIVEMITVSITIKTGMGIASGGIVALAQWMRSRREHV